eukprot:gene34698-42017_t
MEGHQTFVDENGNINLDQLSKELQSALDFDLRYKQTDNMKKRAVKVSTSYDEFKAMVACAHLKKLTKKEVESLSNVKKGWIKKSSQEGADSVPSVLLEELKQEETKRGDEKFVKKASKGSKLPRTAFELDRDLRRLKDFPAKYSFLCRIGQIEIQSMLNKGADVDLVEGILQILYSLTPSASAELSNELVTWFGMLTGVDKFGLTLKFADRNLIASISSFLESRDPNLYVLYASR